MRARACRLAPPPPPLPPLQPAALTPASLQPATNNRRGAAAAGGAAAEQEAAEEAEKAAAEACRAAAGGGERRAADRRLWLGCRRQRQRQRRGGRQRCRGGTSDGGAGVCQCLRRQRELVISCASLRGFGVSAGETSLKAPSTHQHHATTTPTHKTTTNTGAPRGRDQGRAPHPAARRAGARAVGARRRRVPQMGIHQDQAADRPSGARARERPHARAV